VSLNIISLSTTYIAIPCKCFCIFFTVLQLSVRFMLEKPTTFRNLVGVVFKTPRCDRHTNSVKRKEKEDIIKNIILKIIIPNFTLIGCRELSPQTRSYVKLSFRGLTCGDKKYQNGKLVIIFKNSLCHIRIYPCRQ